MNIRVNPPFRLLYDLRWMQLGVAGGVEQATYELVHEISRLDRKNSYRIYAPRSACWEWDFPRGFNVRRHYSDAGPPGPDLDFDLVLSTCSYIHPDRIGFPGILTIHDLQHLHYPDFFSRAEWENRERVYRQSALRARHVICISEFTRRDVHERYGIPLSKMTTVWNIPSRAVWREGAPAERRRLLAAMGVEGPFLFYPAQNWPHKNHAALVEAFRRAAADLPGDVKLIFTGRPFAPEHPAAALMADGALGHRVRHLGFRSPLEVRALFQECLALVFPSLFEGFGMPVAEAIIAGKPVVCSNVASLPEIAGEAAITFDPTRVEEMAARIHDIATRPELRAALAAAAVRRRPVFSARARALRTRGVYERVFAEMGAIPA